MMHFSRISLLGYVCRHRTGIVVGAFLLGLLLRGTVFFEIQVILLRIHLCTCLYLYSLTIRVLFFKNF
uniref:Ovule protein n=1 Tax=Ascaris lumbricoides TaxID=6252 RepID=A0A0M3HKW1_ASCLU